MRLRLREKEDRHTGVPSLLADRGVRGGGGDVKRVLTRKAIFSSCFILLLFKSASERGTSFAASHPDYTDKKENEIFLIYKETQMGAVA
jgi:hypothetical protein